ncbi:CatB-related O-acetyltransferase [Vagococcus sp. BWB3-3]|uniref:CatB-related O-acetyltransferase n=1 Tax=Vagococcus allomyrinae TaxID=2794353 RepID=A0A940PHG6_9ENTE|nr:CatB-related O-acetyltransferase [Vagococcus allomyrinae]MBP1043641.1 CatB-related O-acetyltransferase [Vagococcus allomyrinae]
MYTYLSQMIKLIICRKKWRNKNLHNYTSVKNLFSLEKVSVGKKTYGALMVRDFGEKDSGLEIGNYCSIANGTEFILGGEHSYKNLSTFPFKRYFGDGQIESFSKGIIRIEDDVWIGANCTILSGITIGKGCVVGAGSVVRSSIPPYCIFVGDKVVKKRFSDVTINRLQAFDWSSLTKEEISNNLESIYSFDELELDNNKLIEISKDR